MTPVEVIKKALDIAIAEQLNTGATFVALQDARNALDALVPLLPKPDETRCFNFSPKARIRFIPGNGENWQADEMIHLHLWAFETMGSDGVWRDNKNIESIEFPRLDYVNDGVFKLKASLQFPACDSPF